MASTTFNPVAGANSPCDGRMEYDNSTSWASVRSQATAGTTSVTNSTDTFIQGELVGGTTWAISRSVFNFDTSALTAGTTITGAVFSLYSTGSGSTLEVTNPANISVVVATPASTATLASSDYASSHFGTTKLSTDYSIATFNVSPGQYHDITLNASGIAAINKTGITTLGVRPSNDFSDATAPTNRSFSNCDMADNGSNPPKLTVTYTTLSTLSPQVAVFTLTGNNMILGQIQTLLATVGVFILTGINVILTIKSGWTDDDAPSNTTWNNDTAPSDNWHNDST